MRSVSIRPPWPFLRANCIFESPDRFSCQQAFALWKNQAAAAGFALNTDDITPPGQADCVWLMSLPERKADFDALCAALRPGTKLVLQPLESPLFIQTALEPRNHARFDRILTYDWSIPPSSRYVPYRIPVPLDVRAGDRPYPERRCAVMLNTNRMRGWMEARRRGRGLAGLPGIGSLLGGWKLPAATLLSPGAGELYSWRRRLARAAERTSPPVLDLYGKGWRGERHSWIPRHSPGPYRCALEAPPDTGGQLASPDGKYELLSRYRFSIAVENYRGRRGYISEKMIDVFRAGSVPVYLGEETIETVVPAAAFVDARRFSNLPALLSYLARCPEPEWTAMRAAGRAWLASPAAAPFGNQAFADTATTVLRQLF